MNLEQIFTPKFKGYFWSNVLGITILVLIRYFGPEGDGRLASMASSEFTITPILMGIISGWFWDELWLTRRQVVLYSLSNSFIAILLSAVFMGEGIICLIIVSPLIWAFMLLGRLIGDRLRKWRNGRLNASIVILLAAVFVIDVFSTHSYENEVSDTIIIHAPPAKVWPNVVAFKRIEQSPHFWLFKIGLPSPVESTVTGYCKGAGRKCIFSNNYVFDEVISTYDPAKNLVFDITHQPRDPEIMNHLDLERGQFLLKDNGNGTTTLTGNSWYKLYVFPSWYYDLWAKSIVSNVHTRVMQHIKELSEQ
jgi:hypothetical protein